MKQFLLFVILCVSSVINAQDNFIGEIRIFAGNFAPNGWAFCDGQILPISQNTALFSLLGTNYGGNGNTTFALPNLNGRTPIGSGQGSGLTERYLGETGGVEFVQLNTLEIPAHQHTMNAIGTLTLPSSSVAGNSDSPANAYPATVSNGYSATAGSTMKTTDYSIDLTGAGSSLPHNNLQPYLTVRYIIALQGIFPQRQ